jgi:hypothetical protein
MTVAGNKTFFERLNKYEPYIFLLIVLLNAWPVFSTKFFLTHDGPAHIYNSVLLRELIFGNDPAIHNIFALNHELVPNMISHVLMALMSCVFPVWVAEKIVLLIYFIGLPYAFRFFLRKSAAPTIFFSSLIIPVTYSYFLYMGFYNFLLALLPFFMLLTLWTNRDKKINWLFGLKLFLCFVLLYFSHIYVFALALLLMGLHTCMEQFGKKEKKKIKIILRDLFFLMLVSSPLLFLAGHFIFKTPLKILPIQPSVHELARALFELSSLNRPGEFVHRFTSKIGWMFALLVIAGIIFRFIHYRKKEQPLFKATDNWLIAAFILFCLYFTVPDYIGGGMNCLRIQQLMVVCIIVWIGLQLFPRWVSVIGIGCVLLLQLRLVCFYAAQDKHSDEISEWVEAGKYIDKGTLTLPIVFSDNEQWIHSSGYLGATSSIALYANYEAGLQWFPVIWNNNYMVRLKGLKARNPLTDDRNPAIVWMSKPILYPANVIVWDRPKNSSDSISFLAIDSLLQADYKLTYQSKNLRLFKQKK